MFKVYQTTCHVNGKVYVGVHGCTSKCRKVCKYLGSGTTIAKALKKHGRENFSIETLFIYKNEDDAYLKEADIVDEDFIKRPDVYNEVPGGKKPPSRKGWHQPQEAKDRISETSLARSDALSERGKQTMNERRKKNDGKLWTDEEIARRQETRIRNGTVNRDMSAANSPEAIAKRVQTRKERGYQTKTSHLHSPEVIAKRNRTRILNQAKKGKVFSSEALLRHGIQLEEIGH